jgi:predicted amidohydrolase YtcJ
LRIVWTYCVVLGFAARAFAAGCSDSDLVIRNAHIVTMDDSRRSVTAMAVRDGKIVVTGDDAHIQPCVGKGTKLMDLGQETVLPGLIDIHTHAMFSAKLELSHVMDLTYPKVHSIAEIKELVRGRLASLQAGEWMVGNGWDDAKLEEHRFITRQDLDAISPRNPVVLIHVSGHLATANTAALVTAGVTPETAEPSGGVIQKNASGELTGVLKDNAQELVLAKLPPEPADLSIRAAKLVSEQALAVGLTTIHDIDTTPAEMSGYQDAYNRGWLKLRVQMAPLVRSVEDAEQLVKTGVHTGFGNDYVKFGAVKTFADGGMGARTIAVYPPAAVDVAPDNLGLLIWKPSDMQKAHHIVAAAGWQIETHAVGDRAIDSVLDSYEFVMKDLGLKDPRFRVVHCGISTPAIQKRLQDSHVLVDGNPAFVYWIGTWFGKYGSERMRWSYPGRSYFDNGILVGAGSDVPVTALSPWWGLYAAVTRRKND